MYMYVTSVHLYTCIYICVYIYVCTRYAAVGGNGNTGIREYGNTGKRETYIAPLPSVSFAFLLLLPPSLLSFSLSSSFFILQLNSNSPQIFPLSSFLSLV